MATGLAPRASLVDTPPELLARIEEHLDKPSLTTYIRCCKYLRGTGVRTLLVEHPVVLRTAVGVRSFCDFMHADLSNRKPFLRSLALDTPYPSQRNVLALRGRLAHALINAPNLTWLEFGGCLKDVLEHSPGLFTAIHSLTSLTKLRLRSETGLWPHIILRTQNAPLSELNVGYIYMDTPDAFNRHIPTLQSLSIGYFSIRAALGHVTYANVHTFNWFGDVRNEAWDISEMLDLFPNLEDLSVQMRFTTRHSGLLQLVNAIRSLTFDYKAVRAINQKKQASRSWARLRHLSGDPTALYLLSVNTPVHTLSIVNELDMWESLEQTHDIVNDIEHPLAILHLKFCPAWHPELAETLGPLSPNDLPAKRAHLIQILVVELFLPSDVSLQKLSEIVAVWPVLINRIAPITVLLHVHIVRCTQADGVYPTAVERYLRAGGVLSLGKAIWAIPRGVALIYLRTSWQEGLETRGWVYSDVHAGFTPIENDSAQRTVDSMLSSLA